MKRYILMFIVLTCINFYPQESIIVDSAATHNPIEFLIEAPGTFGVIHPEYYNHDSISYDAEVDNDDEEYFDEDEYYDEDDYYNYDDLGIKGFALSVIKCTYFDKDLFNLHDKIKLDPGYAMSIMFHVTEGADNLGFDFKAANQVIRFKDVLYSSYDLYLLSFGVRYRKNFGNEDSYPYLLGCAYLNKGYFFNGGDDPITFKTYTIGAGAGYNIYVNNKISFALEGSYESGFGFWDDYPSDNSSSDTINPSNLNFRIILGINF